MGANDGLIHAAVMALVEVAEFIGQAVVANVTPTQLLGVVLVDAAHNAGGLVFGIVIRPCGVVDDNGRRVVRVFGFLTPEGFVGAPPGAGNNFGQAVGVGGEFNARVGGGGFAAVDKDRVEVFGGFVFEQVNAGYRHLDGVGGLDVNEVGALAFEGFGGPVVEGVGVEPWGPGSVGSLAADEGGDVFFAVPGEAELGECLVAFKFFDGAVGVAIALFADGRVVDDDVFAIRQAGGGHGWVDGFNAVFLGF